MQSCGTVEASAAFRKATPLLLRLTSKLVLEVLPASLASMIGAMLLAHYHFAQPALFAGGAPAAAAASPEMLRLVRDEHDLIRDFLVAQQAAEKRRHAATDAQFAQAASEAKLAAAAATSARLIATVVPAEPRAARAKSVAVAALPPAPPPGVAAPQGSPAPLAIAGLQDNAAPAHNSLVATTLAMKDHVVSATWHAVMAIGGIPSWIGHRLGGDDADAGERPLSAAS